MEPNRHYKLTEDTFIRKFKEIAIVYNQKNKTQLVFDGVGSMFLSELDRKEKQHEQIIKNLYLKFKGITYDQISIDYYEFINKLNDLGLILINGKINELYNKNMYNNKHTDKSVAETSAFLKKYFKTNPSLYSFQFYVTKLCNEKCLHCYIDNKKNEKTLSTSRMLEIINELAEMNTMEITFTGGEPFLNKDLVKLLECARNNDMTISILSNLTLLNKELVSVLKKVNIEVIQTSVYSMRPEVHDNITSLPGSHAKTMEAIKILKTSGINVNIACPIMNENVENFDEVIKFANKNEIPIGCDITIMAKENGEKSTLKHRIKKELIENVMKKIIDNNPEYKKSLDKYKCGIKNFPIDSCGAGNLMLCVKDNGDCIPCPGFGYIVGNVQKNKIKDIWENSDKLIALRKMKREEKYNKCLSCDESDFCAFCIAKFHNENEWNTGILPNGYCNLAKINKKLAYKYIYDQKT